MLLITYFQILTRNSTFNFGCMLYLGSPFSSDVFEASFVSICCVVSVTANVSSLSLNPTFFLTTFFTTFFGALGGASASEGYAAEIEVDSCSALLLLPDSLSLPGKPIPLS